MDTKVILATVATITLLSEAQIEPEKSKLHTHIESERPLKNITPINVYNIQQNREMSKAEYFGFPASVTSSFLNKEKIDYNPYNF